VAAERRVPLIDLHRLSIEILERMTPSEVASLGVPKEDGTLDRTHLSSAGSALFGGLVAEELARVVPELETAIGNSGSLPSSPYEGDVPRERRRGPKTSNMAVRMPSGQGDDPSGADAPPPLGKGREGGGSEAHVSGVQSLAQLLDRPLAFFSTSEAARIGENVLLWQRTNGGWPKNIDMVRSLDAAGRERVSGQRKQTDTTIDNGATYTQIRFLARLHEAARDGRFKAGAVAGIDYLLAAQYPNGGWPQFFPVRSDYSRHITFNDGAMAGVLTLLQEVAAGRGFGFVDPGRRTRAERAVEKGIAVLLGTQVVVKGKKTGWGAQHDAETLEPRPARTFEPVALASSESVGVIRFLMTLPSPSPEVTAAVDAAVDWLRSVQINGLRVERRSSPSSPAGVDVVATPDPSTPPVWARFYEIGTNRPIFSGRDGVVRSSLAQIEHERRTGYAWYVEAPASLLSKHYPAWKAKQAKEAP
jgi:PelA/Pel-15E family pectate lyase